MPSFKPLHFFIHPVPLTAIFLTALNDHYLKYQYPGFITGKLSDFTGLFYFPLFLSALIILGVRLVRRDFEFNRLLLLSAIAATDLLFALFKLNLAAKDVFVNWFSKIFFTISVTSDATDLMALTASLACYFYARRFFKD